MPPTSYMYHTAMQGVRGIYRGRGARGAYSRRSRAVKKCHRCAKKVSSFAVLTDSYGATPQRKPSHETGRPAPRRRREERIRMLQPALNLALNGLSFWPNGPGLRPGIVPCSFAFDGPGLDWRFLRARPPRGPFP